jgi:hypothetical protein
MILGDWRPTGSVPFNTPEGKVMAPRHEGLLSTLLAVCLLPCLCVCLVLAAGCSSDGDDAPVSPAYMARNYLRDTPYANLRVEVDYVAGYPPRQAALNLLRQRLIERCNKNQVTVLIDDAIPNTQSRYDLKDITNLETIYRDAWSAGNTAILYVLYLNGSSTFDTPTTKTLAHTFQSSAIAVFKESIDASATATITATEIESSVLIHETGHLLGLVNNGTTMVLDHEERHSPFHCTQPGCVMHFELETTDFLTLVTGALPDDFCDLCKADLRHAGGK